MVTHPAKADHGGAQFKIFRVNPDIYGLSPLQGLASSLARNGSEMSCLSTPRLHAVLLGFSFLLLAALCRAAVASCAGATAIQTQINARWKQSEKTPAAKRRCRAF
jgi:hypothetical protein